MRPHPRLAGLAPHVVLPGHRADQRRAQMHRGSTPMLPSRRRSREPPWGHAPDVRHRRRRRPRHDQIADEPGRRIADERRRRRRTGRAGVPRLGMHRGVQAAG